MADIQRAVVEPDIGFDGDGADGEGLVEGDLEVLLVRVINHQYLCYLICLIEQLLARCFAREERRGGRKGWGMDIHHANNHYGYVMASVQCFL